MARFFVPRKNIQQGRGVIDGRELQHLRRVLRLERGDRITLFDDAGWEYEGLIQSIGPGSAAVEISRSYQAQRESALDLTLAIALTKGDKMDFIVEKATELGVCRIMPFVSLHAVVKLDGIKAEKRAARWQKIALSAAKQSGRTRVPEIAPLAQFRQLVEQAPADVLKLIFWEKEGVRTLKQAHAEHPTARSILAVIGPEGGFSDDEAALARAHSFYALTLGERILRAETAAVTALSLVQYLWGDLGQLSTGADC